MHPFSSAFNASDDSTTMMQLGLGRTACSPESTLSSQRGTPDSRNASRILSRLVICALQQSTANRPVANVADILSNEDRSRVLCSAVGNDHAKGASTEPSNRPTTTTTIVQILCNRTRRTILISTTSAASDKQNIHTRAGHVLDQQFITFAPCFSTFERKLEPTLDQRYHQARCLWILIRAGKASAEHTFLPDWIDTFLNKRNKPST